jgi:hypothetical protein
VTRFAIGQYVEPYPTIPSSLGESTPSGTRAIVRDIDPERDDDAIYLVVFLGNERPTGEDGASTARGVRVPSVQIAPPTAGRR